MGKIAIIGSGFVGQATGITLAEHGQAVEFVDTDREKVMDLKRRGYRAFLPDEAAIQADVFFLTVPSPSTEDGSVNLSYIRQAGAFIGKIIKESDNPYPVVVVKSTVPPGTTEGLVKKILEEQSNKKNGENFGLAMMPEYLREVVSLEDARKPRLVVIGTQEERTFAILSDLFNAFQCPVIRVTPEEAEFQKYVHNCFNAAKISFFNEMREIGKKIGIDADKVFDLVAVTAEASWNPRYGIRDLGPFDGSCLPKDTRGLLAWTEKNIKQRPKVLGAIVEYNDDLTKRTTNSK